MAVLPDLTSCWALVFTCCTAFTWGQSVLDEDNALSIAAFNIKNLGMKKIQNEDVLQLIIKIISRYDIVLVQEIVDKTETVIFYLLEELNRSFEGEDQYSIIVGPRVGRTTAKEQYAYIYWKAKVDLLDYYSYHDPADAFEREPFVAIFTPVSSGKTISKFALVGIHTKPADALAELQHLHVVADNIEAEGTKDIIILGDFNADCDYVRRKHWSSIPLWTNLKYVWLIGDEEDTTASASNCAYDRIVVVGDKMERSVVDGSAFPFRFDDEYGLDKESAIAVSDHYPVEVTVNVAARAPRRPPG